MNDLALLNKFIRQMVSAKRMKAAKQHYLLMDCRYIENHLFFQGVQSILQTLSN